MAESRTTRQDHSRFLAGGIFAALSASICCLGPLFLLTTGISGAWMSRLMLLEPYQPLLIAITIVAFAIAGRKLLASNSSASNEECCTEAVIGRKQYFIFLASALLALVFISSEYWILLLA